MYLGAVITLALFFGGIFVYLGVRILGGFTWIISWLRGSAGLILIGLAIFVFIAAHDLSSYDELLVEKPIASLSFEKIDDQHFNVNVSYYINKAPADYEIYGDQWQIDARIIRWRGVVAALGAKPGFALERISGRYLSLEEERRKKRSVYSLDDVHRVIDIWELSVDKGFAFPWVDAHYGSAAFLPMADKASYMLSLSHNGLTAKPTNEIARNAIEQWR